MEEYERTDKTRWQAMDFMYEHLLSTGQSWSHVQKLKFVTNLSEMFKRIERKAKITQTVQLAPQFDAEKVRHLTGVLMYLTAKQGEQKGKENITAYTYDDYVLDARKRLFSALGIDG